MRKLSKKYDLGRRLRSFRRHMILFFQSFIVATILTGTWYKLCWTMGYHFSKEDEVVLTSAIIPALAITYGIMASTVFGTIWEKYQKVVTAVLRRDKNAFLTLRDERIPIMIHLLIFFLSAPLLFMVSMVEYRHLWSGITSIFWVAFIVTIYWLVVAELENPAKGAWFSERIPAEWLTIDVDEHFRLTES